MVEAVIAAAPRSDAYYELHMTDAEKTRAVTFGDVLRKLARERDMSLNAIAGRAGCNPSYLSRCVAGRRNPPTRALVESIAGALSLRTHEQRVLLRAAGYTTEALPPTVGQALESEEMIVLSDELLTTVAGVLEDEQIPWKERAEFRAIVSALARQFRRGR